MFKTQLSNVCFFGLSFLYITTPSTTTRNRQTVVTPQKVRIAAKPRLPKKEAKYYLNKVSLTPSTNPKAPLNEQGKQFVKNYIRQNKRVLLKIKRRSHMPFEITDSVFAKYSLPIELKYLAVIESELKTSALSPVGALGPWQFMRVTAHTLGLKVTRDNDERTSYPKSTVAAAKYLKRLYAQYGDWLLVVAAYNSGPGPVNKAIRQSGSRNFWEIQNYLPAETRCHVKRFIATHYYFEGKGGVTTLTKTENVEYARTMNALVFAR